MDLPVSITVNTNPNPLRAKVFETAMPNVAVQAIDIPLPHTSSQQIVFTGLNFVSHYYRLYEVVAGVEGAQLDLMLLQPNNIGVTSEYPLELHVGTAPTDKITPATSVYNGTTDFPQYAGLKAKVDYWIEQRGVGKLKDSEYDDNTGGAVTFSFKLNGGVLFNDLDDYWIVFKPTITVNPANFPPARVELYTDIVTVNTSRTIDATYANKMMSVVSPGADLTLTMDVLANMPELKPFHFVNNFGLQTQTTIKAATGELIYFNGAEVNQIVLYMGEYLTINKKGTRWYFVDSNVGLKIEPPHIVGAIGEPAFDNGWTNLGGAVSASFQKDIYKKRVFLYGSVEKSLYDGTAETVYQLPSAEYYATAIALSSVKYIVSTGEYISFSVQPGGQIYVQGSSTFSPQNVHFSFDGFSFLTA